MFKENKLKNLLVSVIVCISLSCILSSCALSDAYFDNINNKKDAENKAEKIVEYINSGETEELAKLFNEYSQENYDLESKLRRFIHSIDGEIESYEFYYKGDRSTTVIDGKLTNQVVTSNLEKVKTDQDNYYILQFEECLIDEDETLIGIERLSVRDENWKEIYTVYCD